MTNSHAVPIRVVVGGRNLTAEVIVPPVAEAADLTPDDIADALRDKEVEVTPDVLERVADALDSLVPGRELRAVVAEATSAVHGEDGYIEWYVGEDAREPDPPPSDTDDDEPEPDPDNDLTHYERTSLVIVNEGQTIARVIAPTDGTDGRDVKGRTLPAKPGQPVRLRCDDSIEIHADGAAVARSDGVLSQSLGRWAIRPHLLIPGYVDFSTGNIDFSGDIEVVRGIRDCFVVRAEGNLQVLGLVEAATLETGGNLHVHAGVAARERGSVKVGGDLEGRYFDAAHIEVGGALRVTRELINCTTLVHGPVESPGATMIGGILTAAGPARLAVVGSRGGAKTRIVLGSVPKITAKIAQADRVIEALERRMNELQPGKERDDASSQLESIRTKRDQLADAARDLRVVDLWVSLTIHHATEIVVDNRVHRIAHDLQGPIVIKQARDGSLIYNAGDADTFEPLAELCVDGAAMAD